MAPPDVSAANEGDNPSRADLVRAVLANPSLALLDQLQTKGPLRTYLFGNRLRSVPAVELASFAADGDEPPRFVFRSEGGKGFAKKP